MLTPETESMMANGVLHAVTQFYNSLLGEMTMPAVLYHPDIYKDGDKWCCLLGEDIQSGVAGFGDTPHDAVTAFNKAWYAK